MNPTVAQQIAELRMERQQKWEEAKAFLDSRRSAEDLMSTEDVAKYDRMEAVVVDLGRQIDRLERQQNLDDAIGTPTSRPLVSAPGAYNSSRGNGEYNNAFWNALRGRGVSNVLSEGVDTSGGFLVPEEFSNELIEALTEQNIFRQIARIINTSREKLKVPVATAAGTASWIDKNEQVPESDSTFGQVILNAYKLGTLMKASTELIEDAAFNMQSYIAMEFARRIGVKGGSLLHW